MITGYEQESDPSRRSELIAKIIKTIPEESLGDLLSKLGPNVDFEFRQTLLRRWTERDPAAAAAWVASLSNDAPGKNESLSLVASVWAGKKLDDAAAWAKGISDPFSRERAVISVGYEAARTFPREALTLAAELMPGDGRDALLAHAAAQWAIESPEDVVNWAGRISEVNIRDRILASAAEAWSDQDPVAAANMVVERLTPGRFQEDAVMGIVQRWMQKEPEAALAWIQRFPEGDLRRTALEAVGKVPLPQVLPR
jgi:hypothetical protein